MKILAICGSNRKEGNTYLLLKEMFSEILTLNSEIIQIAELQINSCELCFEQCAQKPFECVIQDDLKPLLEKIKSADCIIIACPFYFYVPSKFQAFLERISCLDYYTRERHGEKFSPFMGKPCALIATSASGSSFNAFQILHHLQEFVLMLGMQPAPTDSWPFIGLSAKCGLERGAVLIEKETINQAKMFMRSLINAMQNKGKL